MSPNNDMPADDPPTILVVDDQPTNIRILGEILQSDYRILVANNGETAIEVAEQKRPDLILLDIMMPDIDGYEVCARLRKNALTERIPVIFVSALNQAQHEEVGLELGAIDYLTKPLQPAITRLRIRNQLKLKKYQDYLAELSMLDGLTRIPNRRRFDEALALEWRRAIRAKSPLSLIMMDIDAFKPFNDHYGHQAGDACLQEAAQALHDALERSTDLLARYGGEEFACLLPETDAPGALVIGEKLRRTVAELEIPHEYSPTASHITLSLGLATLVPRPGMEEPGLIGLADDNLYKAKKNGRNQLVG